MKKLWTFEVWRFSIKMIFGGNYSPKIRKFLSQYCSFADHFLPIPATSDHETYPKMFTTQYSSTLYQFLVSIHGVGGEMKVRKSTKNTPKLPVFLFAFWRRFRPILPKILTGLCSSCQGLSNNIKYASIGVRTTENFCFEIWAAAAFNADIFRSGRHLTFRQLRNLFGLLRCTCC